MDSLRFLWPIIEWPCRDFIALLLTRGLDSPLSTITNGGGIMTVLLVVVIVSVGDRMSSCLLDSFRLGDCRNSNIPLKSLYH